MNNIELYETLMDISGQLMFCIGKILPPDKRERELRAVFKIIARLAKKMGVKQAGTEDEFVVGSMALIAEMNGEK